MGETYTENAAYTQGIGYPGDELPRSCAEIRGTAGFCGGFSEYEGETGGPAPREMIPPAKKAISASSAMSYRRKMEPSREGTDALQKAADIVLSRSSGSYESAFRTFSRSEYEESPTAQFFLGVMRLYGYGTGKDEGKAFWHMDKAYRMGNPNAAYYLGIMYLKGIGTPIIAFKAMALLKEAAKNNKEDHRAELQIGLMYIEGIGTAKNEDYAFKWIKKSAEHTNTEAQFILGQLYKIGYGCEKDPASMTRWLEIAANKGHVGAQILLGNIFRSGDGVRADKNLAQHWFDVADGKKPLS